MNDDELRAIAEAARVVTALAHEVGCGEGWDVTSLPSEVTEHFATFDPPRVLGLLDRVQTAEAERDDLRDLMCRQNLMAATTEMRAEQAEAELNALRAAVEALPDAMARAWGGSAAWLTTGSAVGELVREWITDALTTPVDQSDTAAGGA